MNSYEMLNTPTKNSANIGKVYINNYNFYIARQGGYDERKRFSEVSAILTLEITETLIDGNTVKKIEIYFRSEGAIARKYYYSDASDTLKIEYLHQDLDTWLSGLKHPTKYLDISNLEPGSVQLYLFAGSI
ncbi:hypothetical protein [Vibrio splendidus]|uniref:hypothetical protein n=1 Tax=Vibrio splendidus TaxID=29497 RepID=UPI000D3822D4|nr:hypothetical protein [Vibrio splendidus]PTP36381.1 hypothetical protein CWN95_05495 [Vibrio splendidus]